MVVDKKNIDSLNDSRSKILEFENLIKNTENAVIGDNFICPLKHSFADGIYVREIFIPKDMILTGKIHKHSHPNFLLKGEVEVFTEFGGVEKLVAPQNIISKAGTKRVVKTITDTIWVTVHANPTNTQDLEKLENWVEIDDFITKKAITNKIWEKKLELAISEWKFHQVKKMLLAINNEVIKLHRISIWDIKIGDLTEWNWRYLNDDEISYLENKIN